MFLKPVLTLLLLVAPGQSTGARNGGHEFVSSRIEDRIVKRFDFDEAALGNYDAMPMNWRQIAAPGHPRFLEPQFDHDVGRSSPPSFRFALQGGSLACEYLARDIHIHPQCDYLVTAWVRTRDMVHSGAFITAYYLDHALRRIEETERRSALAPIGDRDGAGETWTCLKVALPGGNERARWIGLSLHVEQPERATGAADVFRPIIHEDIAATAWFDDVSVLRLPRVELRSEAVGGIFEASQPVRLSARIADLDGSGVTTRLELRDADGELVASRPMCVVDIGGRATSFEFDPLPVGYYEARLQVFAEGEEIVTRRAALVRLGESIARVAGRDGSNESASRGIGILLEPGACGDFSTAQRALELIEPAAVKVPLWRRDARDAEIVMGDARFDRLIRSLRARQVRVVGVLEAAPPSLASSFGHRDHSVVDILSASRERWRPYFAFLAARYGAEIDAWQIGGDDAPASPNRASWKAAVRNLEAELHPLVGRPLLVAPQPAEGPANEENGGADVTSVYVPEQIGSNRLAAQMQAPGHRKDDRRWVTIEAPRADRIRREAWRTEFARSMAAALQTGAEFVFALQPWRSEAGNDSGNAGIEMDERFLTLRTLGAAVDGLAPGGVVSLAEGVTAHLFSGRDGATGSLILWSDGAAPSGRVMVTDAAPRAAHYDLWGRPLRPEESPYGRVFEITEAPSILVPVDVGRVRTIAGFGFDEPEIAVQVQMHRRKLRLHNHLGARLSGVLAIDTPKGWSFSPSRFKVDLSPGQEASLPVEIRVPMNQPVGRVEFVGRLESACEAERRPPNLGGASDAMTLRAHMEVVGPGLDVNVLARQEGDYLHIMQRITNRTGRSVDLRSVVVYPDLRRDSGMVRQLADGASAVREYSVDRLDQLRALPIRVTAESLDGRLRVHRLVRVE